MSSDTMIANSTQDHKHQNVLSHYNALVENGVLQADNMQRNIAQKLDTLCETITIYKNDLANRHSWQFWKKSPQDAMESKGLYLFGDVGRGKSLLMDLFFEHAPIEKKRRVHFHAFMADVHERLHQLRQDNGSQNDALLPVAKHIAKESWLLCFDEFQVTNIADAMILGRLFEALFAQGVVVVATSNRAPEELYKDGLQRDRFLPFIALLKQKVDVASLDGDTDYRLQHMRHLLTTYYTPLGKLANDFVAKSFAEFSVDQAPEPTTLVVKKRKIVLPKTHGRVAWCEFAELCGEALGANDFLAIAQQFTTLILANVPQLSRENRNEAMRFVTLIDVCYEHKVKMVISAAVPPEQLYVDGDGSFEFHRTVSRLIEMESESYWNTPHISLVE